MGTMAKATAAVWGTDINQPKGAVEETMAAVTVMVVGTRTVTVTATITMLMQTPMTAHQ